MGWGISFAPVVMAGAPEARRALPTRAGWFTVGLKGYLREGELMTSPLDAVGDSASPQLGPRRSTKKQKAASRETPTRLTAN
jgi:hypothetical protein